MDSRKIKYARIRVLVALYLVMCFTSFVYGAEYSLFTGDINSTLQAASRVDSLPVSLPRAVRWRPIQLNQAVTTPNILAKGDVLNLSLFADTDYVANIDRISKNVNNTMTVRGRIIGFPLGYLLISTSGGRSLGSIRIPEKNEYYIIQNESANGTYYLLKVNADQLDELEDEPALQPMSLASQLSTQNGMLANTLADNPTDQVVLDAMIVYTPAARIWGVSNGGIDNIVAQAVALGQLALDNSNTYMTLNLVYSGEINYTENGDTETDLKRLTFTTDGYMDNVHSLRNQYSADVVALFAKVDDTGGISWLLDSIYGDARYAFSVCRVQQISWSYTYIHEAGHLLGCGHHKLQLIQPGPGLFSYSAGWRWVGNDNVLYSSVMTYDSGQAFADGKNSTRIGYFSNPDILYKGVATGDSVNADNARTIRETKFVVAGYRSISTYIDIGLRYYDGSKIIKLACEYGRPISPLQISKKGNTYGIALVDTSDPYASGIIIQTSSGLKAIRKLQ